MQASVLAKNIETARGSVRHRMARAFMDALFPRQCVMCSAFFLLGRQADRSRRDIVPDGLWWEDDTRRLFSRLMAAYLCPVCLDLYVPVASPMCPRCGLMFKSRKGDDHLCEKCMRMERAYGMARAAGVYDKALMTLIHAFKYGEKTRLARPLSALLLDAFLRYWPNRSIDLVVPVPLYRHRFRQRGFNQAFLLVKDWPAMVRVNRLPHDPLDIDPGVLERIRATPPQTSLGRRERLKNVKQAFSLTIPRAVEDRRILLVDDVYTTGATANECARVLVKGGARSVDILTLARAM